MPNINLKTTNMEAQKKVSDYLDTRIKSIYKFVDLESPNNKLDIELETTTKHHKKGNIFRTELNLHVGGKYYRAESKEYDVETSIDKAKDDLVRQLRRNKDKKVTMTKKGGAHIKRILRRIGF